MSHGMKFILYFALVLVIVFLGRRMITKDSDSSEQEFGFSFIEHAEYMVLLVAVTGLGMALLKLSPARAVICSLLVVAADRSLAWLVKRHYKED